MSDTMQWVAERHSPVDTRANADRVVAWVNANGGEARYVQGADATGIEVGRDTSRIMVRARDGWAYCAPGQRVVMGESSFIVKRTALSDYSVREFTVTD